MRRLSQILATTTLLLTTCWLPLTARIAAAQEIDAAASTTAESTSEPAAAEDSEPADGAEQTEESVKAVADDPTTIPPANDPAFELQGEYVGEVKDADGQASKLGLQIRPIGGNRFEALQYAGGLPGETKTPDQVTSLIGTTAGDMLILSGGPWAIFAEKEQCTLVDKMGNRLGTLQRIERGSPTMGAQPPEGAVVLFDGSGTDQFTKAEVTAEGLLKQGADVKPMFQDFNMHVEFRLPYMPEKDGQQRGNSGCYLQSRYEVQVLDSFAQLPVFNGCSSIYRIKSPDVNMCLPPLRWQTYDIEFTAPRWAADGSKVRNARLTVWHNGVKTQDNVELESKTGAGKPEEPTLLPIKFQDHSDQVRFRNIWVIDRGLTPVAAFPLKIPTADEAQSLTADQL